MSGFRLHQALAEILSGGRMCRQHPATNASHCDDEQHYLEDKGSHQCSFVECESRATNFTYCRSGNPFDHLTHPRYFNVNQGKNWICIDCGKLDVHEAARLQEIREKNELNRIRQEQKAAKDKEYATWYDGLTPLMKSLANLDRLLSRPRLD